MHHTISSPRHLIAQLPHFFGFDVHDSLVVMTTSSVTHAMGPLLRADISKPGKTGETRQTISAALRRLADREFGELHIILISSDWTAQGAAQADAIDEVCEELAYSVGFTIKDFYMARHCHPGGDWVSLYTGEKGRIPTIIPIDTVSIGRKSAPKLPQQRQELANAREPITVISGNEKTELPVAPELQKTHSYRGLPALMSREETQEWVAARTTDISQLSEWDARTESLACLSVPSRDELRHILQTTPTQSVHDPSAVVMRQFLLRCIESCQGADGLIALLADRDADQWAEWMWELIPSVDLAMRSYMLLALALWYYMHGDGFRAHTMLDQAAIIDPQCIEIRQLRQLLAMCIEPKALRIVVDEIAESLWEEGA